MSSAGVRVTQSQQGLDREAVLNSDFLIECEIEHGFPHPQPNISG